jgi:Transcriptional regulator containing an amidase domain and an AraC-type DNA-binding HTH domain
MGVTAVQLGRRFYRERREHLSDYLKSLQVQFAMYMLRRTDDCIDSIARRCLFFTPSTFTRAFRRFAHTTPSEFRAECRRDSARQQAS